MPAAPQQDNRQPPESDTFTAWFEDAQALVDRALTVDDQDPFAEAEWEEVEQELERLTHVMDDRRHGAS